MTDKRRGTAAAFACVTLLFFIWGAVTSVNDVLIPAMKKIFTLSDREAFLTQFAFFMAYFIVSLPAAWALERLGSAKAIVLAIAVMVVGCLLFPVAAAARTYTIVLVGLFVIASGITLLQVAANPLSAALGRPERSHFRLVLSQTFNSFGTVVGPYVAAHTLLQGGLFAGGAVTEAKITESLGRVNLAYGVIAAILVLLGIFIFSVRGLIDRSAPAAAAGTSVRAAFRSGWALAGALAIFVYVGAEVSIGSAMVLFLEQPDILAVSALVGGQMVSLYWLGAMVGRAGGSGLLAFLPAPPLLALFAVIAGAMCLVVFVSHGPVAAYTALAIGLFNSIMFPVIFTLTIERSSAPVPATSGLLCMAIVGGAVLPFLFAQLADATSRSTAFVLPAGCYLIILLFALAARRKKVEEVDRLALSASH